MPRNLNLKSVTFTHKKHQVVFSGTFESVEHHLVCVKCWDQRFNLVRTVGL